jgi:flagellar hook-basal body complex protein FliE
MNAIDSVVSAVSTVAGTDPAFKAHVPAAGQSVGPAPFADLLSDAVGQVGKLESEAHATVSGLMTGTGVDVHTAMIATEKASMGFEMALAVRNKAVQAYQSVIGMQF